MAAVEKTKRRRFIAEYLKDGNATKAAIRAGYSPRSAHVTGSRLLKNAKVREAVDKATAAVFQNSVVDQARWLKEMETLGLSDMADFAQIAGDEVSFTPSADLPEGASRAIQEITQKTTYTKLGERQVQIKIKLHDKKGALIEYGRARGWIKDKLELSGDPDKPLNVVQTYQLQLPDNKRDKPAGGA